MATTKRVGNKVETSRSPRAKLVHIPKATPHDARQAHLYSSAGGALRDPRSSIGAAIGTVLYTHSFCSRYRIWERSQHLSTESFLRGFAILRV